MLVEYRLKMLNKKASKNSKEILSNIEIKNKSIIADIGAGGGYYSLNFSKITGKDGRVYAVDSDIKRLKYIDKVLSVNNITNIKTCETGKNGLPMIDEELDLIFMRNMFHHIENPEIYFYELKKLLKSDGRVVIIDYVPNTPGILITKTRHCTPKERILNIMRNNGYVLVEDIEVLYGFSFTIWTI